MYTELPFKNDKVISFKITPHLLSRWQQAKCVHYPHGTPAAEKVSLLPMPRRHLCQKPVGHATEVTRTAKSRLHTEVIPSAVWHPLQRYAFAHRACYHPTTPAGCTSIQQLTPPVARGAKWEVCRYIPIKLGGTVY